MILIILDAMMGGAYLKIRQMTEFQTAMTAVTNQVSFRGASALFYNQGLSVRLSVCIKEISPNAYSALVYKVYFPTLTSIVALICMLMFELFFDFVICLYIYTKKCLIYDSL